MDNFPLTIFIPTYNRSANLSDLLNNLVVQAGGLKGLVQICISNNGSTDNTRETVEFFQKKHPDIIKYHENKENLGLDENILNVMDMADGKFVWLLGDDDTVVWQGVKKVVDFVGSNGKEDIGLIILGHKSYVEKPNGDKILSFNGVDGKKPKTYLMDVKDIIGMRLDFCFLSVMLLNNVFLKKIIKEENRVIKKAVGAYYIHVFLYHLMLFKYQQLKVLKYNEEIINNDSRYYKVFIEDSFRVYYSFRKEMNDLFLSLTYVNNGHRKVIIKENNKLKMSFIKEMVKLKTFGAFNHTSFMGCIKMFFQKANPINAAIFSVFFIVISVTPSLILKTFYKSFVKFKYGAQWKEVWLRIVTSNHEISKGSRRLIS